MKFVCPLFALAFLGAAEAFRVESTGVAPPADILGEHQELEKTFSVYSEDALEKLSIAIAGPVFIAHSEPVIITPAPTTPEPTEPATPEPTTSEPATPEPTTPEPTTPEPTTPEPTTPEPTTPEPTTVSPTPTVVPVDGLSYGSYDGSSSSSSSSSGSGSSADDTIVFPTDAVRSLSKTSHHEKLVATITISGNSSDLLELVDIVPVKKGASNGIRLTYKNKDASAEGFVLTQIQLAEKHDLRHLSASVASTVDVASGVLSKEVKEKKIKIASYGATKVFISEESDISAHEIDVDVAGSGTVQLIAASLDVQGSVSASVAGSGTVAIHAASVKTSELKVSASGSGGLFVTAKKLSADQLSSSVYGSAFTSFAVSESGEANKEKLTVAGSGAAYIGSVVAKESDVDIYGSGIAYVQVTEKLKTSASYSGTVYYVGAKPTTVKTSGWFFWRSAVKPASDNKFVTHEAVSSPPVYPSHVTLSLTEAHHADEPQVKTVDITTSSSVSLTALTTHLTKVAHGPNGFLIFGSVAVGLVAVGMLAQSYQQHRVRRHYMPLV